MKPEQTPDTIDIERKTTLTQAFRYAILGIKSGIVGQRNIKIHIVIAILALIACAILRCTYIEWAIVIVLIGIVIAAELFNSAIESAVDLASLEINNLAKLAKDIAAGAVLVLSIVAAVVGLIIYINALLRFL